MFCSSCGMPIDESARFCGNCGAPVEPIESPDTGSVPDISVDDLTSDNGANVYTSDENQMTNNTESTEEAENNNASLNQEQIQSDDTNQQLQANDTNQQLQANDTNQQLQANDNIQNYQQMQNDSIKEEPKKDKRQIVLGIGTVLSLALVVQICLPYMIKAFLFAASQKPIESTVSLVADIAGTLVAIVFVALASRFVKGSFRFGGGILLIALIFFDQTIQPFLVEKADVLFIKTTYMYLIAAIATKVIISAFIVVALRDVFVKGKVRIISRICAFVLVMFALVSDEVFSFIYAYLPMADTESFISTFGFKLVCALIEAAFLSVAAKSLINRKNNIESDESNGTIVGTIVNAVIGVGVAVASIVISFTFNGTEKIEDIVVKDISIYITEGEMLMTKGDMPAAVRAFEQAGEHYNAWIALANGEEYNVPEQYYDDEVLTYLSLLDDDPDYAIKKIAISMDKEQAPMWLALTSNISTKEKRVLRNKKKLVTELTKICVAREEFVFEFPTLKDIKKKGNKITEYLGEGESYKKHAKIAKAYSDMLTGNSDITSCINTLLDLSEEYTDDIAVQYAAAYMGSQNTWDNAGHYERTAGAINRFLELWEDSASDDVKKDEELSVRMKVADMLINMRDYTNASVILEKAKTTAPDSYEILDKLSTCYLQLDDLQKGYDVSKAMYAQTPDDVVVLRSFCIGALKNNHPDEAIKAAAELATIVQNDSGDIEGDLLLFNCVLYLSLNDDANWTDYQYRILDGENTDPAIISALKQNEFLYNYCQAVYYEKQLRDPESALPFAQKALSMQEGAGRLWYLNGMIHFDLEQFDKAKEEYLKADAITPDDPSILFALANVYDALEDYKTAYSLCKQALAHFPNGVDHHEDHYGVSYHAKALYNSLEDKMKEGDENDESY